MVKDFIRQLGHIKLCYEIMKGKEMKKVGSSLGVTMPIFFLTSSSLFSNRNIEFTDFSIGTHKQPSLILE